MQGESCSLKHPLSSSRSGWFWKKETLRINFAQFVR